MKRLLTLFWLISTSAFAQPASDAPNANKNDGRRYVSKANRGIEQRTALYAAAFDTSPLATAPDDVLRNDSLGKSVPVMFRCETCKGRMKLAINGDGVAVVREFAKDDKVPFPLEVTLKPGSYHFQYWQNRVLQVQLPFTVSASKKNEVTIK